MTVWRARADLYGKQVFYCTNDYNIAGYLYCYLHGIHCSRIIKILYCPSLFCQDDWVLALFSFLRLVDLNTVSVQKQAKKELGQYPALLTSRSVNNPYPAHICVK